MACLQDGKRLVVRTSAPGRSVMDSEPFVKVMCIPMHSFSQCCAVAGCYLCNSQFPTGKKKIENSDHLSK